MSQNRGYRRDRQSYQMNTSSNFGNRNSLLNVNPWEGGLVPGNSRSGLAGLLPTPPQQSSLVSQLSSTEAQLAIASNLLTSLLRPQQNTQPQVPSLLSLGALGQIGNVSSGYQQQSYYGSGQNRYPDSSVNRHRNRMENRRSAPYNKNTKARRSTPSKDHSERKLGQGLRSPVKKTPATGSKLAGKADDKEHKDKDGKANKDVKGDEEDNKREDGDRKDEKKGEDGEILDDKERDDIDDGSQLGSYDGIPHALFYCHVCKKHMWDGTSFDNHMKGRTHQLMMDKLEESYKIRVELMRHKLKVAQQQREIEMDRMKRQGKKVHMMNRLYCTMCDLSFIGHLMAHRRDENHQALKKFLHPKCSFCKKEFPTRIEWDHHRLTPQHLKKVAEVRKNRKDDSDDDFMLEDFDSDTGSLVGDYKKREMKIRTREEEEEDIKEVDKSKDEAAKDEKDEGEKEGDEIDDLANLTSSNLRSRIPKYNPDSPVGLSLLKKVTGQKCRACNKFFATEEDGKTHCRTLSHYNNYVTVLKFKARAAEAKERREALAEEKKKSAEKSEKEVAVKEEEDVSYDEGNWKRRKVVTDEAEDESAVAKEENSEEKDEEMPEESTEKKPSAGEEKYDPLEADAEASSADGDVTEEKSKVKSDIIEDDNLWAEVDQDIGSILESVDGEGDAELSDAVDEEGKGEGKKPGTRRGAASNRGTPTRSRGRKRK